MCTQSVFPDLALLTQLRRVLSTTTTTPVSKSIWVLWRLSSGILQYHVEQSLVQVHLPIMDNDLWDELLALEQLELKEEVDDCEQAIQELVSYLATLECELELLQYSPIPRMENQEQEQMDGHIQNIQKMDMENIQKMDMENIQKMDMENIQKMDMDNIQKMDMDNIQNMKHIQKIKQWQEQLQNQTEHLALSTLTIVMKEMSTRPIFDTLPRTVSDLRLHVQTMEASLAEFQIPTQNPDSDDVLTQDWLEFRHTCSSQLARIVSCQSQVMQIQKSVQKIAQEPVHPETTLVNIAQELRTGFLFENVEQDNHLEFEELDRLVPYTPSAKTIVKESKDVVVDSPLELESVVQQLVFQSQD